MTMRVIKLGMTMGTVLELVKSLSLWKRVCAVRGAFALSLDLGAPLNGYLLARLSLLLSPSRPTHH